jgi:hypothetical protein
MAGLSIVGTDRAFRERRPRRDAMRHVGMSRDALKVITSCFSSREYLYKRCFNLCFPVRPPLTEALERVVCSLLYC